MKMKNLFAVVLFVLGAGMSFGQSKIGHVNSQQLLEGMESRKAAIVKMQEFEKNGYEELQTMQTDLETSYAEFEKKAGDLSPILKKIEEEKLMKKQQALQERQQSLQTEMQAYSEELNAPILQMLQDAVKRVAKAKKLNYVIDVTQALFANGEDITEAVKVELKKLDDEYLAQ